MATRQPLGAKRFIKVNRKVKNFIKRTLPKKMLREFIKNTPSGKTGRAKRSTNLQIEANKFTITGKYPYSGVLDYGGYPNPPKEGTGKTFGGYSTQAPDGMSEPTLEYGNKILRNYIRRNN